MILTKEFIDNVRMLAIYRGYVNIAETYGVKPFAEQIQLEYREKYGFELIDSFHLREEILRLMNERKQNLIKERVSKRQIHFNENNKPLCGTHKGIVEYIDMKLTLIELEVTCKRCKHSLDLRKGQS